MKNKHTHSIANIDNPKEVLQKLRNWLDDECWTHFEDTDARRPILVTMAGGQHPLLPVLIHFCKRFHTIFFMAMLSVTIPKTRLPQVLEFIDMANEAEKMAPLALSLQNNEVCAVTRVSLTTAELTDIEIKAAFEDAVHSIDAAFIDRLRYQESG